MTELQIKRVRALASVYPFPEHNLQILFQYLQGNYSVSDIQCLKLLEEICVFAMQGNITALESMQIHLDLIRTLNQRL